MSDHIYLCVDLKAFYASVECVERGLDPLTTNLVVADVTHTRKMISLAVSLDMAFPAGPAFSRLNKN